MITKITMNKAASYKYPVHLETDKKTNLIYGLNGTGKSTFSNYLYNIKNKKYTCCSIEGLVDEDELLVYNQSFIFDNFYESETLKGIFTLSKENKSAKQAIDNANLKLGKLRAKREEKNKEILKLNEDFAKNEHIIKDKVWEIKTSFSGGDKVLEYCLENLKGSKNCLFSHLCNLQKPSIEPEETIDKIKNKVKLLEADNEKVDVVALLLFAVEKIEQDSIFEKVIVGNQNSSISELIIKMKNSDWVKSGLSYIENDEVNNGKCPFCQEKTITKELINKIKEYFDESYEKDIKLLELHYQEYKQLLTNISDIHIDEKLQSIDAYDEIKDFNLQYRNLLSVANSNINLIEKKIKAPSNIVSLNNTKEIILRINKTLKEINKKIADFNSKIDNKEQTLKELKTIFWKIMRWKYDSDIELYNEMKMKYTKNLKNFKDEIDSINGEIKNLSNMIKEQQSKTVNIDEAVANINSGLLDLGIDSFSISKSSGDNLLYRIIRNDTISNVFETLSEGEKMIISFLYFIELCKGKTDSSKDEKRKIVVIDDPISSLSHIFVFNIGRLIHNEFLRSSKYEQVFILTHSLYFFYELTCMKKEDRDVKQNLIRLIKDNNGSQFLKMHYQEIQNDYQSYWYIIKDQNQPPALIANCMRNIIEYFFNFIEKVELNNVFAKNEMKDIRFQAFYRYMNRESHSLGQNIFDFKEFNYDDFKEAFRLLFEKAGYIEHYKKMIK